MPEYNSPSHMYQTRPMADILNGISERLREKNSYIVNVPTNGKTWAEKVAQAKDEQKSHKIFVEKPNDIYFNKPGGLG